MKAEIKPYYDSNRKKLADIIPLAAPFTVYIEQTRYCNFKCYYCIHSTRDDKEGEFAKLGYEVKHMDENLFSKIIKELGEFPQGAIKRIVFSGLGEPLANPNLPKLVETAVNSKIANRVEVITNGVLLTPDKADALIKAGITNINISIQGIDEEQYHKTCDTKVNLEKLVENLAYLHKIKGKTQIYIKIIDALLQSKEEEELFFKMFGNLCDKIYIEHLVVMQQQMENLKSVVDEKKNFYNEELDVDRKVCAQAFYFLQIGCDGHTFPCPNPGLAKTLSMGNVNENTILEIWNGEKRRNLLRSMLELKKDTIPECRECTTFNCINNPLENLDADAERLVKLFE